MHYCPLCASLLCVCSQEATSKPLPGVPKQQGGITAAAITDTAHTLLASRDLLDRVQQVVQGTTRRAASAAAGTLLPASPGMLSFGKVGGCW